MTKPDHRIPAAPASVWMVFSLLATQALALLTVGIWSLIVFAQGAVVTGSGCIAVALVLAWLGLRILRVRAVSLRPLVFTQTFLAIVGFALFSVNPLTALALLGSSLAILVMTLRPSFQAWIRQEEKDSSVRK